MSRPSGNQVSVEFHQPQTLEGLTNTGEVYIRNWQLAFVHDCNLRCEYCVTGYGRLGKPAGVMSQENQDKFINRIFTEAFRGKEIHLDFGNGETLFYFDEFIRFIELAEQRAESNDIKLSFHVATNGTGLDEKKLQILASHQVDLTFSIDGPAHVHDRYRKDREGKPTHARALASWRRYLEISRSAPGSVSCQVTSVVGDDMRLLDVNDFWLEQGLETYKCGVVDPSDFIPGDDMSKWNKRRTTYLQDLEQLAMEQASKLTMPGFLSDYRGPDVIKTEWINLLTDRATGVCGVAQKLVGIDMNGNIYPCDNFTGKTEWMIGNIEDGFHKTVLLNFRNRVNQLRTSCNNCAEQQLCEGGCVATRLDTELKLDMHGSCAFHREVADIARRSYQVLLANS
jgi:uncharacterized protein